MEPEENTFSSLVADLTHRCNMECANCYLPNRDVPDMDKDKLFDLIQRLPQKTFIRLIGAEPTMRTDLVEIVQEVIRLGHHPSLTTNGLRLGVKKYTEQLKHAGLKMVLISMNGIDDDEVYKILDNGKYANLKMRALDYCMELGFFLNIGCIIAKGVNEHCIKRSVEVIEEYGLKHNVPFRGWKKPAIRLKTVGQIGRYMKDHVYTLEELAKAVSIELNYPYEKIISSPAIAGSNLTMTTEQAKGSQWKENDKVESYMFEYETKNGPIWIRLVDWHVDEDGVVNSGNQNRGRITKNWKVAPFFEDVKLNEFGY